MQYENSINFYMKNYDNNQFCSYLVKFVKSREVYCWYDKAVAWSLAGLIHYTNPVFANMVFQAAIVVFIHYTNQNQKKHTLTWTQPF